MKITKHSKTGMSSKPVVTRNIRSHTLSVSPVAVAKAERYLSGTRSEFIAKVREAKTTLAKNEAGPLAGSGKLKNKLYFR